MASTLLVLIRHGSAAYEPERLLDIGREQVRLTAERLRGLAGGLPDRVVHSPLPRAVASAEIIGAALGLPLVADELLAECMPAVPPAESLTAEQQAAFASFTEAEVTSGAAQAAAARDRYLAGGTGVEVAVSHGNLIRWLVAAALGADPAWFQLADYHCGLSAIVLRPGRRPALLAYNDVGHLPPELRGDEYPPQLRW
jgi:serine/threonine-protein phosphatase PGAM5